MVNFQFLSIFDEHNWVFFFGIWGCTCLFNVMAKDLNLGIKIVSLILCMIMFLPFAMLLLFLLDLGIRMNFKKSYKWFIYSLYSWCT